jgi:NAD(P)-dependent dehydrogenase (short-subunit alcohol dehydrogenase family)
VGSSGFLYEGCWTKNRDGGLFWPSGGLTHASRRIAAAWGISLAEARTQIETSDPQRRIVQPEEVAARTGFFCSDRAPGFTSADVQINAHADW